jgi:hypothetical protein
MREELTGEEGTRARRRAQRLTLRWAAANSRFLILTTGRTGSELLVSLLNSHPRIICDGEILNLLRDHPDALVIRRSVRARIHRASAYGFKLLAHQAGLQRPADPAGYIRSFPARGFRLVLLERRDWLMQAISAVRAARTQHHYRQHDQASFTPMRIDPIAVIAALYLIEEGVTFLRSAVADLPHLSLCYEDDLAPPERQQTTVDRVCAYLGVDPAPVSTDLVKLAPPEARRQLENFDELASVLSRTRYARFLGGELA